MTLFKGRNLNKTQTLKWRMELIWTNNSGKTKPMNDGEVC